jgi:hypothetical protein
MALQYILALHLNYEFKQTDCAIQNLVISWKRLFQFPGDFYSSSLYIIFKCTLEIVIYIQERESDTEERVGWNEVDG